MKAVQITYMGKPLHQVYPHATRWQVIKFKFGRAVRWLAIRLAIIGSIAGMLFAVHLYDMADAGITVVNQVVAPQGVAPILKRIAAAESQNHQFDANGLPLLHANSNGSVDIGLYQINNRVWGAKAKELGFDLLTEKGQTAMATWILENKGTSAWNSSSNKWQ